MKVQPRDPHLVSRGDLADTTKMDRTEANSGTREVSERLRFDVAALEAWIADHVEGFEGPLTVSLRGADTLHLAGGHQYLDIVWDALDGVAEQAEGAGDRGVNRHQHIEYLPPDDEFRSPASVPLIIVSDWPDAALRTSDAPGPGPECLTGRPSPEGWQCR